MYYSGSYWSRWYIVTTCSGSYFIRVHARGNLKRIPNGERKSIQSTGSMLGHSSERIGRWYLWRNCPLIVQSSLLIKPTVNRIDGGAQLGRFGKIDTIWNTIFLFFPSWLSRPYSLRMDVWSRQPNLGRWRNQQRLLNLLKRRRSWKQNSG